MPIRAIVLDIGEIGGITLEEVHEQAAVALGVPAARFEAYVADVRVIVYSHEVGMMKPDPAIYGLCLERLCLPPQEAVFVDDVEANCAAACALGMAAIRFQDTAQVIRDLDALLRQG